MSSDRKATSMMLDDLSTGIDQATTEFKSLKSTKDMSALTEPAGLKAATKEAIACPPCRTASARWPLPFRGFSSAPYGGLMVAGPRGTAR